MNLMNIPLPADLLQCERPSNVEANNFEKKGKEVSWTDSTKFWGFIFIFDNFYVLKLRGSLVSAMWLNNPLSFLGND